jgi:hypothetical protein
MLAPSYVSTPLGPWLRTEVVGCSIRAANAVVCERGMAHLVEAKAVGNPISRETPPLTAKPPQPTLSQAIHRAPASPYFGSARACTPSSCSRRHDRGVPESFECPSRSREDAWRTNAAISGTPSSGGRGKDQWKSVILRGSSCYPGVTRSSTCAASADRFRVFSNDLGAGDRT